MKYLKKRKMFEISKKILALNCDVKLSDCEYRFYRGTEWLRFCDNSYIYELCASGCGNYLSVEKYVYDDDFGKRISIYREVLNGWNRCGISIG